MAASMAAHAAALARDEESHQEQHQEHQNGRLHDHASADPTFRSYNSSQAAAYAAGRGSYGTDLCNAVLSFHVSTGGAMDQLLDVGCGPGNATRDLAPAFDDALGVDAGPAMIEAARSLGGDARLSPIRYECMPAESCNSVPGLAPSSVDLLTVAMAVHWFDLPQFYASAAKALKPGGTLAMWCVCSAYPHPSMPNYDQVREVLLDFEHRKLELYTLPGNRICMDLYRSLPMPWDGGDGQTVADFDAASLKRLYWNEDGQCGLGEPFFAGDHTQSLDEFARTMGTASMVTRWRAAHPEASGEKDVVAGLIRRLRGLIGEAPLRTGGATVLVMLKKRIVA